MRIKRIRIFLVIPLNILIQEVKQFNYASTNPLFVLLKHIFVTLLRIY